MKLDDGRVELFQGKLIQNSLTNALKNGKNLFAGALAYLTVTLLPISQGCSKRPDSLRGYDMTQLELAQEFKKLLGADGKGTALQVRIAKQLQLGKDPCPEPGLFLDKRISITGPHYLVDSLLAEFMPQQKMDFAWCARKGATPNAGSVFLDEFMYETHKCRDKDALQGIKKLKGATGKLALHIKNICHTLKNQIGELGLYVEIDAESVTHKELAAAPSFNLLYLKVLELHVLPKETTTKENQQRSRKLNIDRQLRAATVLAKPEQKLRTIHNVLHGSNPPRFAAERCTDKTIPLKLQPVFHFNYFNSTIVKKAKSSGAAAVSIGVYKQNGDKRDRVDDLAKILLKPDQIIGFKPPSFRLAESGDYEIEVRLDSELAASRKFAAQLVAPENPAKPCRIELDTGLTGVTKDSVSLNL